MCRYRQEGCLWAGWTGMCHMGCVHEGLIACRGSGLSLCCGRALCCWHPDVSCVAGLYDVTHIRSGSRSTICIRSVARDVLGYVLNVKSTHVGPGARALAFRLRWAVAGCTRCFCCCCSCLCSVTPRHAHDTLSASNARVVQQQQLCSPRAHTCSAFDALARLTATWHSTLCSTDPSWLTRSVNGIAKSAHASGHGRQHGAGGRMHARRGRGGSSVCMVACGLSLGRGACACARSRLRPAGCNRTPCLPADLLRAVLASRLAHLSTTHTA